VTLPPQGGTQAFGAPHCGEAETAGAGEFLSKNRDVRTPGFSLFKKCRNYGDFPNISAQNLSSRQPFQA
jgi:hypothetical protein